MDMCKIIAYNISGKYNEGGGKEYAYETYN